ncbi:MAG: HAD family hydrolase [Nitrosospira sp.]
MAKKRQFVQDTIALVYDFDGTLSPQPMQEYTVLPKLKIEPSDFWAEVHLQSQAYGEESMLTYMRLLLEKAEEKQVHIGCKEFNELGKLVKYFPGVESWFDRIDAIVKAKSKGKIKVRHYIISAGLREIINGVSIKKFFKEIFASEYHYDHHKRATFPKLLITDTAKTQFLFRINKGKEDLRETINSHMAAAERPIPFENIIYIGDGETDVPSMTVTLQNGGNAIAVFRKGRDQKAKRTQEVCKELLKAGRINFVARADYSEGSVLERRVHLLLDSVMARIEYQRELFVCKKEQGLVI